MPSISFVVPVHNAERTIKQCVDSLTKQTVRDIEVVLVENGSTDGSLDACKRLAREDSRIFLHTLTAADVNKARNYGFEHSHGDYIAFCDSDDWVTVDFSYQLLNVAKRFESDIVRCGYSRVLSSRAIIKDNRSYVAQVVTVHHNGDIYDILAKFFNPSLHHFTPTGLWGGIYRRSILQSIPLDIRENDLRRQEDMLVASHAFYAANSVTYIPNPLYCYRYGGVTSTPYRVLDDLQKYYELMIQSFGLQHTDVLHRLSLENYQYVIEVIHDAYFALSKYRRIGVTDFYSQAVRHPFIVQAAKEVAGLSCEQSQFALLILDGNIDNIMRYLSHKLRFRLWKSTVIRYIAQFNIL